VQIVQVEFDKDTSESSLAEIANVSSVRLLRNKIWLLEAEGEEDIRHELFAFAVKNSLTVLSLQKKESNLEEVFRHLTNG
jgi:ABC-2 type transport system ATP-binding protein